MNSAPFEEKDRGWMGDPKRGASMGRPSEVLTGKVHLCRVRLDQGGYDKGGAYWGHDLPLWCAWTEEGRSHYVRARTRDDAKKLLYANPALPGLTFYR